MDSSVSPKISGIYLIRRGERVYVGSAVDIIKRWRQHKVDLRRDAHKNSYLQNAWNKHGEDAFTFEVLEECEVNRLLEREQYYIDLHPDRYNLAPVAGSSLGIKRSPETRAKISAAKTGTKASPEARANMSASKIGNTNCVGHKATPEARENMSAAQKGRKASDETRVKLSAAQMGNTKALGRETSDETRARLSASSTGNTNWLGRKHTPEAKAKISAAKKAYWERKRAEKDDAAGPPMDS